MNRITSLFAKPALAIALGGAAVVTPFALAMPAAPVQAAEGDLDKAVSALRGISTMTANFTQTDRNGQRMKGVLTLKQPGKIRFQYEESVPLLIVSDGKALTLIDYEVNQVQRWPISNSPLGALLDPNRDVKKFGKLQRTTDPNVVSVEVRDPKRPEFGMITLVFQRHAASPGGLKLVSWVALDSQNKRTTVRLSGHRYGVPVGSNAFKWKDPRKSSGRR